MSDDYPVNPKDTIIARKAREEYERQRQSELAAPAGSVRTGKWRKSPTKEYDVEIIREHQTIPYALIIKVRGRETVVLKSEVTETTKAPNEKGQR